MSLHREAMEEALAEEERRLESHVGAMVQRFAAEEFADGGDLGQLGERLIAAAKSIPQILDLVVVDPERQVVRHFSRRGGKKVPCVVVMPLRRAVNHEHPAGKLSKHPVACKTVPVVIDGRARGTVLFHATREAGARAGAWVERTAFRLLPVFLGFYVLLGVLLVLVSRAARRWRDRAASAERVQALGALAAGINHEIKNPLNSVGLSLQLLAKKHPDPETQQVVDTAGRQADRILQSLDEFARFTRVSRLETEQVALGERLRVRFGGHASVEGDADARVDARKVDDAVAAIVEFMGRHGDGDRLHLGLSGTRAEWRLSAEGAAGDLDAGDVGRLFDPYFRAGKHDIGRGLALARAVFQAHGGDLVANLKGSRLVLRGNAPRVPPGE